MYDIIGALTSLLSTYFFIRLSTKAWIIGIIATCFNGWLYWEKGIYGDMCLETLYFFSMCYLGYRWSEQKNQYQVLNKLSFTQWTYLTIFSTFLYCIIFIALSLYTHSDVVMLDALTTTLSIVAQLLMCYKVIITWIIWFITDVIYGFLYYKKGLPFHTFLMFINTGLAVSGYMYWANKQRDNMESKTCLQYT